MSVAFFVVLGHAAAALALGWAYFRRYGVARPPIGVINLGDVGLMLGGIILVPYLYLMLPSWLVAGLLALALGSTLYLSVRARRAGPPSHLAGGGGPPRR